MSADPTPVPLPPHRPLPEYYPEPGSRRGFVSDLFDSTAHWYDSIDGALSFGWGPWYRREALRRAGLTSGMRMLDVATGTGVVARAGAEIVGSPVVIGLDPSIGMLRAGRDKTPSFPVQAMGERLPFRSSSFDLLSVGFALRHMADLAETFAEFLRVLSPGGRVLILEITPPKSPLANSALRFYMGRVIPQFAKLRTGSDQVKTLMSYYWDTIEACVPPDAILSAMRTAGFTDAKRHVVLGVFSEYSGVKS